MLLKVSEERLAGDELDNAAGEDIVGIGVVESCAGRTEEGVAAPLGEMASGVMGRVMRPPE